MDQVRGGGIGNGRSSSTTGFQIPEPAKEIMCRVQHGRKAVKRSTPYSSEVKGVGSHTAVKFNYFPAPPAPTTKNCQHLVTRETDHDLDHP